MNCLVIDMGRVSLLFHGATTVTALFWEQDMHNGMHYTKKKQVIKSDQESDEIRSERSHDV